MSNTNSTTSNESAKRRLLIDQMQVLGEVASTETALFHQAAAAQVGLGITDMKALSVLWRESKMTAGQLAERLNLTTGAITNVIDRLQKQGFVERQPDPQDRRKVIVIVRQEKLSRTDNVYHSMGKSFSKLLNTYSTTELEFLVRYYKDSIALTKQEVVKLDRPGSKTP